MLRVALCMRGAWCVLSDACLLLVTCCVLRAACCVLRVAWCVLRVACYVLRAACCMLHVACCVLRACRVNVVRGIPLNTRSTDTPSMLAIALFISFTIVLIAFLAFSISAGVEELSSTSLFNSLFFSLLSFILPE